MINSELKDLILKIEYTKEITKIAMKFNRNRETKLPANIEIKINEIMNNGKSILSLFEITSFWTIKILQ